MVDIDEGVGLLTVRPNRWPLAYSPPNGSAWDYERDFEGREVERLGLSTVQVRGPCAIVTMDSDQPLPPIASAVNRKAEAATCLLLTLPKP